MGWEMEGGVSKVKGPKYTYLRTTDIVLVLPCTSIVLILILRNLLTVDRFTMFRLKRDYPPISHLLILVQLICLANSLPLFAQEPYMRQLTTHPALDSEPTWSPDAKRIAFVSERSGNKDIWVMDVDGQNKTQLTTHLDSDHLPSWSPDGNKIAFVRETDSSRSIWVMSAKGRDISRLVPLQKNQFCDKPNWSPGGEFIAFVHGHTGTIEHETRYWQQGGLGLADMTDEDIPIYLFTSNTAYRATPVWSPDGKRIAYRGNSNIWIFELQKEEEWRLTELELGNIGSDPSWSPDGNSLACVIGSPSPPPNDDFSIISIDINTREHRELLGKGYFKSRSWSNKWIAGCSWGPNGKIAFEIGGMDAYYIWLMDYNGGNKTKISSIPSFGGNPAWSPSGQAIAFASGPGSRAEHHDIWIISTREFLSSPVMDVAIVEFVEIKGLDIPGAGKTVTEWMSSSLHRTKAFNLFERVLLEKVFDEQDLGLTGALDMTTVAEIGKVYGVEAIVAGIISKFGDTYTIVVKLIDTETAKVLATADIKTPSIEALANEIDTLARKLVVNK